MPTIDPLEDDEPLQVLDAVTSTASMNTYTSGSAVADLPHETNMSIAAEGVGGGPRVEGKLEETDGSPRRQSRACGSVVSASGRAFSTVRSIVGQCTIWAISAFAYIPAFTMRALAHSLEMIEDYGGTFGRSTVGVRIFLYRAALKLLPSNACFLHNLARAMVDRFDRTNQAADLDEAISLYRASLKYGPSGPLLNNLAAALRRKPGRLPADLDESILLLKQAHTLQPSEHLYLLNLAGALKNRFDEDKQGADINEAITLYRQAMKLKSSHMPTISGLADALRAKFWPSAVDGDFDEPIALYRQCLELQPSSYVVMNNLGLLLLDQYRLLTRQKTHLREATDLFRNALRIQPLELKVVENLGLALGLYSPEDKEAYPDEAFFLLQKAARLCPTNFDTAIHFVRICGYRREMGHPESAQVLDERISFLRRLHNPKWRPHHPDRLRYMGELGRALKTRYMEDRDGSETDINEAISIFEEAAEICPPRLSSKYLFDVAYCLRLRQSRSSGRPRDINVAISLYRQFLRNDDLSEDDKRNAVEGLARALLERYRSHPSEDSDLIESISFFRQTLTLRPFPDSRRAACLSTLAAALECLYNLDFRERDLGEVITLSRQALNLQDANDPERPSTLIMFARSLIIAIERMGRGTGYLDEATSAFSEAMNCTSVGPSLRLGLAKQWIHVLGWANKNLEYRTKSNETPNLYLGATLRAWDTALEILHQVAPLGLDAYSRHRALSKVMAKMSNLIEFGRTSSSWLMTGRNGNPREVIETLEAGRNIFWAQARTLRAPLHRLQESAPWLADKLKALSSELERRSHTRVPVDFLSPDIHYAVDKSSHLQIEWSTTVAEARKIPGFEGFLKQPSFSGLHLAASEYPIVFLFEQTIGLGCGCLIMTSTNIHDVFLGRTGPFLHEMLMLVDLLQAAVSSNPISRRAHETNIQEDARADGEQRGMRPRNMDFRSPEDSLKYILRVLWERVVIPVIQCLGMKKSTDLPILKWCPSGIFSQLPLHAAGCYDDDATMECASDYFISSYTPNLGTLLMPDPPVSSADFKMMAIIQSVGLSATKKELEVIKRHVPPSALMELGVPGAPATIEEVASRLSDASIVHFACHGAQNKDQPLDSGLMLEDGLLSIARIMRECVPHGSLAFLCACKTATGDTNLPDEAIALAASLLFSGFRNVIATMWEIRDEDGPVIADAFYEELFRGPNGERSLYPDNVKSARALHIAVQRLRSKNVGLRRWVPFIHTGK